MIDQDRPQSGRAELLLLTVVLIWASNFPIAKWGISGLSIFLFNSVRYISAVALLAVIYFSKSAWAPIARGDWPKLIAISILASIIYQLAFILGLSLTTAGNSAVLLSTAPLWTVFLNAIIHKEQIKRMMWLGMFVSMCGVVMIIIGSGKKVELGSDGLIGDLITIAAAMLWGLNTNLQKPLLVRYSPLQLTLFTVAFGAVGLSVIAIPSAVGTQLGAIHWTYYLAAVISGTLAIAVANVFWSVGVKNLGPARTANFGNLVPVLAFIISFIVLNERILPIQVVGAAVTVFGVWVARR